MKEFFVNLYDKFIHLSWVDWTIAYCKREPLWASVIGGLVVFVLLVVCIMCGVKSKAKKKAKKAAAMQTAVQDLKAEEKKPEPIPAPKAEEKPEPVKAEKKAEPKKAEPVAEKKPEPIPAPKAEEKPEPVKAEKKAEPQKAAAPEKKEEPKKVEKELAATAPTKAIETPAAPPAPKAEEKVEVSAKEERTAEAPPIPEDESEVDRIARYKGKWVVYRVLADDNDGEEMYFFELRASNGEKLLSSEEYTSYQGAVRGIQTHKTNILKGNLKITVSKKGDYIFKLLSGKNLLLCMGENYPTKARCESAMDSTIRFAATAILDEDVQDIVIKVPKEDDTPILPPSENSNGKWIISSGLNAEGAKIYSFELFANNGERLLGSEEYTTYTGAFNGIETHKKNVAKDNFRISLTKRGDYIYKLLNGNGQLLCLGEHYRTKRLCQNAVDSVKRFALNSPVLTESEEPNKP